MVDPAIYYRASGSWKQVYLVRYRASGVWKTVFVEPITIVLSADQMDYNLFLAAGSPTTRVIVDLTVNAGVELNASTILKYGLTSIGFTADSLVRIHLLNGLSYVNARGGKGGRGGDVEPSGDNGDDGENGGWAMNAGCPTEIDGLGSINGGFPGGGGGGGTNTQNGSGGGGGAPYGAGGAKGTGFPGVAGDSATAIARGLAGGTGTPGGHGGDNGNAAQAGNGLGGDPGLPGGSYKANGFPMTLGPSVIVRGAPSA